MTALTKDPRAVALLMAATLTIMANATISPALPGIEAMFPEDPNAALLTRLLVTAPSLLVAISAPFAGMAADRFGRRPQLLFGVALFAAAGTAGLVLPTLPSILASRLVLGLAVAAVMTAQAALIGDYFTDEMRSRFMGYQIAATNFGGFLFITLAGYLAAYSPRLPFAIYGIALLMLPLFWRVIREPDAAWEVPGATRPSAPRAWLLSVGAIAALAGATMVLFYVIPTQVPFYLQAAGHPDSQSAGQVLAALTLAGGVSALLFGRIRPVLGRGGTPALGYAVLASGFWVLGLGETLALIAFGAMLVGAGLGQVMPTFISNALAFAPPQRRGAAMGIVTTAIFLGQFLSPLVSQPLVVAAGFDGMFRMAAMILLALAVAMLATLGRRERHQPSASA